MGSSHVVGGMSRHLGGVTPHVHVHRPAVRVRVHVTVTGVYVDTKVIAVGTDGRHVTGGVQGLVVAQMSWVLVERWEAVLLWDLARVFMRGLLVHERYEPSKDRLHELAEHITVLLAPYFALRDSD